MRKYHIGCCTRSLAVILTQDSWIDFILQIAIVLNVLQNQAMLPGHGGSFKSHNKSFFDDPKCQERDFLDLWLLD